jgi:aspartyl-tRNA synthetase
MLAGFDRYMQIARCFRDEDLRADRQPEFTQIDLEMSFVDETDVQTINEGLVAELFSEILGVEVSLPLPRLFYAEAMERYGSDKPDTRFGLELVNLSDLLGGCGFGVFSGAVAAGGSVRGIRVPKGASAFSRKEIDRLTEFVKTYRAKGLAYTRLSPEGETSSFEKFLALDEVAALRGRMGAQPGDLLLLVADADNKVVFDSLGALRVELGKRLGLIDMKRFDCLWVTDFPLFEYDPEEGRYFAMHHPFTSPNLEDVQNGAAQGKMRARAYDLVINGTEIGGGSIRISDPELQGWMFAQLGMTPEEAQARFGFLLDAFRYGVPPHGGMAYGLDRLVMIMLGRESLREVIAFPKVQNASELMSGAPAPVEAKSLDELDIALKPHVTA